MTTSDIVFAADNQNYDQVTFEWLQEGADLLTGVSGASYEVLTILDCGCYSCEYGASTGAMNEAGDGECMAGYDFMIVREGDRASLHGLPGVLKLARADFNGYYMM